MMARQVERQHVGWEKSIAWSMDTEPATKMASNRPPALGQARRAACLLDYPG